MEFQVEQDSAAAATHLIPEEYRADRGFDREEHSRTEGDLENIFFSSQTLVMREGADDTVQVTYVLFCFH